MKTFRIVNQLFYHSIFYPINSNMYMIIENNNALVIDPHYSDKLSSIFKNNNISDVTILLTHEHPDHTSGVEWITDNFKTTLICHENCAMAISDESNNRPILISFILAEQDKINGTNFAHEFKKNFKPYRCIADITFNRSFVYKWNDHKLKFIFTPGHSRGSCCILLDNIFGFTGDSLIYNAETITRFPGGSIKDYINITVPFLKSLDKSIYVLPGHGKIFRLSEMS